MEKQVTLIISKRLQGSADGLTDRHALDSRMLGMMIIWTLIRQRVEFTSLQTSEKSHGIRESAQFVRFSSSNQFLSFSITPYVPLWNCTICIHGARDASNMKPLVLLAAPSCTSSGHLAATRQPHPTSTSNPTPSPRSCDISRESLQLQMSATLPTRPTLFPHGPRNATPYPSSHLTNLATLTLCRHDS